MLTIRYLNPDTDKFEGYSTIQFMSYDQDPENFASGDVHYCLHDEPPPYAIWRENRARVMRGGSGSTMVVSMTWPDNPASPVDWIFDEIYDKGMPGKLKHNDIEIINIYTTMNPHLDQTKVAESADLMTTMEKNTRIFGLPIRFSNRIHPDFTSQDKWWCYECGKMSLVTTDEHCSTCGSHEVSVYNNVESCPPHANYPCVCLLDPHPRKPHFLLWVQVTPNEDYEVVASLQVEGGVESVRDEVRLIEERLQHKHIARVMDPNMGAQPSGAKRELTWQMEFDNVGLHFDLGDDSSVGRARLNTFIKPDRDFRRTRLRIDPSCDDVIFQMTRYVWADHKNADHKDISQEPMRKHDDFPTLLKYLMNYLPSGLSTTPAVYKRTRGQADYKIRDARVNYG
jgi:phage terminase large subunit-like protein